MSDPAPDPLPPQPPFPRPYEPLPGATYAIVAYDMAWFQSFPDVTITARGEFLCVFTRATHHGGRSRALMIARSPDGRTWSEPRVFAPPRVTSYQPDQWTRQRLEEWDCPKIQRFADDHLEVSVALSDEQCLRGAPALFTWRSDDHGASWDGPAAHSCEGIVQDAFVVNPANPRERLVGLHARDPGTGHLRQMVYRSLDGGATWGPPETLAGDGVADFCEVSITPVPGTPGLLAFMRDNRRDAQPPEGGGFVGYPTQLAVAPDFGHAWTPPVETPLLGHRPVARFLADGRCMVTYRDVGGHQITGLWVARLDRAELARVWNTGAIGTFDALFPAATQHFYVVDREEPGSTPGDHGYTGWVQDPRDGTVLVVYYTQDPDNLAYIKAVKVDPGRLG